MATVVETKKGKVEGFIENGVVKYYGVPFAKPPVGDLRFKRAVPVDKWDGVKECKTMPPKPIQFMIPMDFGESEDCLYLNVWAPENAENCPVFVWIYGGGLNYGSNSDPSYDGENMAKQGIVYVAITYRLGPLGWYDLSIYDKSFDSNCGLSDVLQSLRFVKENIRAFGGNPDNITICGESGGALMVMNMLACPAAKGLFHKAIAESAPAGIGGKASNKYSVDLLLEMMHKTPADVKDLRSLPINEIKDGGRAVMGAYQRDYPYIWMAGPVIDDLMPATIPEVLAKGNAEGVDLIIGYNHDEGTCFVRPFDASALTMPNTWEQIRRMLECNGKEQYFDEMKAFYETTYPNDLFRQMAEIGTDRGFVYDTLSCVDAQNGHSNIWLYRFDFAPVAFRNNGYGAVHSAEISYALNTLDKGYFSHSTKETPQEQLENIRDQMNGAWIAFCKTGNPNHDNCEWECYGKEKNIHVFDLQPHNEQGDRCANYELWKKLGVMYSDESFKC